ncbi:MAG TPA: FUSC family protein [Micromonospora sp.]
MARARERPSEISIDGFHVDLDEVTENLAELRRRSGPHLRERVHRVRFNLILAFQAGLAAALAWTASYKLVGNPEPVFAPISAVGTLAASVGQRMRRTAELLVGVVLGIAVGDGLILLVGTGPWQLAVVVVLAIVTSIFLGGSPAVVTQAAATAVLVATLSPNPSTLEMPRVVDALVGGVLGLVVVALLLPLNPLRVVDRAARPALDTLAEELITTAEALSQRDAGRAQAALDRLPDLQEHMTGLEEALEGGRETATLSPARWHRRAALNQYVESAEFIQHAVANSGALIRRAVTLLEDEEPVPAALPSAVARLGDAVRRLRHELGSGVEPQGAREQALAAATAAGAAYAEGVGFSGSVVVAQVRTTARDVLRAAGLERNDANRLIRQAVARHGKPPPTVSGGDVQGS